MGLTLNLCICHVPGLWGVEESGIANEQKRAEEVSSKGKRKDKKRCHGLKTF